MKKRRRLESESCSRSFESVDEVPPAMDELASFRNLVAKIGEVIVILGFLKVLMILLLCFLMVLMFLFLSMVIMFPLIVFEYYVSWFSHRAQVKCAETESPLQVLAAKFQVSLLPPFIHLGNQITCF